MVFVNNPGPITTSIAAVQKQDLSYVKGSTFRQVTIHWNTSDVRIVTRYIGVAPGGSGGAMAPPLF